MDCGMDKEKQIIRVPYFDSEDQEIVEIDLPIDKLDEYIKGLVGEVKESLNYHGVFNFGYEDFCKKVKGWVENNA
jgi:hypothetical protein